MFSIMKYIRAAQTVRQLEEHNEKLRQAFVDQNQQLSHYESKVVVAALQLQQEREHTERLRAKIQTTETDASDISLDLMRRLAEAEEKRDFYRKRKDEAYTERNHLVAILMKLGVQQGWHVGLGKHQPDPDPNWDPAWLTVVYLDVPGVGQLSWHVHDSDKHLFENMPTYDGSWDGTTTEQKYASIRKYLRG